MATEYGKDVSCLTEMRTGRYAKGVRLVAESYFRRLTTPRGMLRGSEAEADFGFDLTEKVGTLASKSARAALPSEITSELMKDERSQSIDVEVTETKTDDGVGVKWIVTIDAVTTEGPFTLQLGVTNVSAELLGITES